jgi:hypothetical protein
MESACKVSHLWKAHVRKARVKLAVRTGKESAGKECACKVNWCDKLRRSHDKALIIAENQVMANVANKLTSNTGFKHEYQGQLFVKYSTKKASNILGALV